MAEKLVLVEDTSDDRYKEIGLFLTAIEATVIFQWLEDREKAVEKALGKLVAPNHRDEQYKNQKDQLRNDLRAFVEKKTAIEKDLAQIWGKTPFEFLTKFKGLKSVEYSRVFAAHPSRFSLTSFYSLPD